MWAKERHRLILSMLSASQQVSANDLAQMLNVSRETVRRDLLDLEESGQVSRVHGGAVLPEPRSEEPFRQRMTTQIRQSRRCPQGCRTDPARTDDPCGRGHHYSPVCP